MLALTHIVGRISGVYIEPNSLKIKIESSISSTVYYGYVPKTPYWQEIFRLDRIGEVLRFEGEMVANCILKIHYVLSYDSNTFVLGGAL